MPYFLNVFKHFVVTDIPLHTPYVQICRIGKVCTVIDINSPAWCVYHNYHKPQPIPCSKKESIYPFCSARASHKYTWMLFFCLRETAGLMRVSVFGLLMIISTHQICHYTLFGQLYDLWHRVSDVCAHSGFGYKEDGTRAKKQVARFAAAFWHLYENCKCTQRNSMPIYWSIEHIDYDMLYIFALYNERARLFNWLLLVLLHPMDALTTDVIACIVNELCVCVLWVCPKILLCTMEMGFIDTCILGWDTRRVRTTTSNWKCTELMRVSRDCSGTHTHVTLYYFVARQRLCHCQYVCLLGELEFRYGLRVCVIMFAHIVLLLLRQNITIYIYS